MDFFNILLVVAAIAFGVFKQTSKGGASAGQQQGRPRKPVFAIDEEEENNDEMPFPKRPKLRMQSFAHRPKQPAGRVIQPESVPPASSGLRQEQKKQEEKPEGRLSLRNPSEARRAFIYSEIWNRKYD